MPCSRRGFGGGLVTGAKFERDERKTRADVLGIEIDGGGGLLPRTLQVALLLQQVGQNQMRHRILGIERDGLLQLSLGGRLLGRVAALDQREGGVEVGAVGIDGQRFLDLRESLGMIALAPAQCWRAEQRRRRCWAAASEHALACSFARGYCLPASSSEPRSSLA